jgi:hypothetical protein
MGGACSTDGGVEVVVISAEKPAGKRPLERLSVVGRIILKWIVKTWEGVMDWID